MAKELKTGEERCVLVLSRKEAVDIIGLLTAQLGGTTLVGRQHGEAPQIIVTSEQGERSHLGFILELD